MASFKSHQSSLTKQKPVCPEKGGEVYKPQGFPLEPKKNGLLSTIFTEGEKEKRQHPTVWSMHPLFCDQPLGRAQATVHKPALDLGPAAQQSEAHSTFKAFKFGKKEK